MLNSHNNDILAEKKSTKNSRVILLTLLLFAFVTPQLRKKKQKTRWRKRFWLQNTKIEGDKHFLLRTVTHPLLISHICILHSSVRYLNLSEYQIFTMLAFLSFIIDATSRDSPPNLIFNSKTVLISKLSDAVPPTARRRQLYCYSTFHTQGNSVWSTKLKMQHLKLFRNKIIVSISKQRSQKHP